MTPGIRIVNIIWSILALLEQFLVLAILTAFSPLCDSVPLFKIGIMELERQLSG